MSRKKFLAEWYANGFNPDREKQNQDFAKAIKQTAPTFDVERLDNRRYSAMNGIDAIVTSPLSRSKTGYSSEIEKAKSILMENWQPVLRGESVSFHIVGMRVNSDETDIWVFHAKSQTLFMLHFATPRENDNWLEPTVYRFQ